MLTLQRNNSAFISDFLLQGFPGGSDGKESACKAGDLGSIPGLGRSPGGGHGNPLQSSCLENPMETGAWRATGYGVAKSRTQLSDQAYTALQGRTQSLLPHTSFYLYRNLLIVSPLQF